MISIHALRGEGDVIGMGCANGVYISIHALRGEGDYNSPLKCGLAKISIHALRGEGDRSKNAENENQRSISIHALRGEGDRRHRRLFCVAFNFNPRPPWGGRL